MSSALANYLPDSLLKKREKEEDFNSAMAETYMLLAVTGGPIGASSVERAEESTGEVFPAKSSSDAAGIDNVIEAINAVDDSDAMIITLTETVAPTETDEHMGTEGHWYRGYNRYCISQG